MNKFKLDNVRISNYVNKERLYKSDTEKVYLAWNPLVSINSGLEVPVLLVDVNLNKQCILIKELMQLNILM